MKKRAKKAVAYLRGKKTFILAGLGGVVFILARLGYVTPELEVQAYTLLGIGSVATLRAGIGQ